MRKLAFVIFLVACGGSDKPAPTTPPPLANTAEQPAAPPPAPPPQQEELTEEKMLALMDSLAAVFEGAGKDCNKLATDLDAWLAKHHDTVKRSKEWEQSLTPEQKQRFEERAKAMAEKMMPSMAACANDEKVVAVMKKMADD